MELVVRKNDLLKELSLLQGIVERKNTIPILANVLIQADKSGGVSLLATDLDVGLRSKCEATVTKPGTLTLPAKKLFEIVNALPEAARITAGGTPAIENISSIMRNARPAAIRHRGHISLPALRCS